MVHGRGIFDPKLSSAKEQCLKELRIKNLDLRCDRSIEESIGLAASLGRSLRTDSPGILVNERTKDGISPHAAEAVRPIRPVSNRVKID